MTQPPPKHETVDKDGYVLTFYPGFLSRAAVQVGGRDHVLYRQEAPHGVKDQPGEPLTSFELRLQGGPNGRDFALHVDDPQRAIAEIVVRLYPRGYTPAAGGGPPSVEVLRVVNDAMLCPPIC